MKRLAVIPSESINLYLSSGFERDWLQSYFNPQEYFDDVYILSPKEQDNPDLLGMKVIRTEPHQLARRIKELGIDIVRAYGGYWACDMACRNKVSNVPVVVSVHDTNPALLYGSIKKADIVFCVSEVVKKTVLNKNLKPGNVWILPNRVNFDVMRPYDKSETIDLDAKFPFQFRILHVGRKKSQKNLDTPIKALKILGPEYCLIASGKGNDDEYKRLAESEGVMKQCFFVEAIPHAELARYYSWADCMCTPSRWEGFGMVFIEALACRAVVVTSDIAPMNEYITHEKNGILIKDFEDPSAMAEAVKWACTDGEPRETLKKNARNSVVRFEKSRIDQLEASYYWRILAMKNSGHFSVPYHRHIMCTCERCIKSLVPVSIRRRLRDLAFK